MTTTMVNVTTDLKNELSTLAEYKNTLSEFCLYMARLSKIGEKASSGGSIDMDNFSYISIRIRYLKNKLLSIKQNLNFDGGLSFLEDNRFDGFEVKGGMLIGDTQKVDLITSPWFYGFSESGNCYLYEIAVYLQCLVHVEEYDDNNSKEEPIQELTKVSFLTILKRRCLAWLTKNRIIKSSASEQVEQEAIS